MARGDSNPGETGGRRGEDDSALNAFTKISDEVFLFHDRYPLQRGRDRTFATYSDLYIVAFIYLDLEEAVDKCVLDGRIRLVANSLYGFQGVSFEGGVVGEGGNRKQKA